MLNNPINPLLKFKLMNEKTKVTHVPVSYENLLINLLDYAICVDDVKLHMPTKVLINQDFCYNSYDYNSTDYLLYLEDLCKFNKKYLGINIFHPILSIVEYYYNNIFDQFIFPSDYYQKFNKAKDIHFMTFFANFKDKFINIIDNINNDPNIYQFNYQSFDKNLGIMNQKLQPKDYWVILYIQMYHHLVYELGYSLNIGQDLISTISNNDFINAYELIKNTLVQHENHVLGDSFICLYSDIQFNLSDLKVRNTDELPNNIHYFQIPKVMFKYVALSALFHLLKIPIK